MTSATSLFSPVEADLRLLSENLIELIGTRHPILFAAAEYLFGAGGAMINCSLIIDN